MNLVRKTSPVRIKWILRCVCWTGFVGILGVYLLGELGSLWWGLDLFSHFRIQYIVLGVPLLLVSVIVGGLWLRLLGVGLMLLLAVPVLPYWIPVKSTESSKGIKLLSFNVQTSNSKYEEVIRVIRDSEAEIVILYEVDFSWMRALKALEETHVLQVAVPRGDNFGIAVWSRGIELNAEVLEFDGTIVESVLISVQTEVFQGTIIGTHPVPPIGEGYSRMRNTQLHEIGKRVQSLGSSHCVVVGDFNTTPWSSSLQPLCRAGLRDGRLGYGISPTWMSDHFWIAIPIDHVWVGEQVQVLDVQILPAAGSDHNGVFAVLATPIRVNGVK